MLLSLVTTTCADSPPRSTEPEPELAGRTFTCLVGSGGVAHINAEAAAPAGFTPEWRVTITFNADRTYRYQWRRVPDRPAARGSATGTWDGDEGRTPGSINIWLLTPTGETAPPPIPTGRASMVPFPNVMWMQRQQRWHVPAVDFDTGAFLPDQHWALAFLDG